MDGRTTAWGNTFDITTMKPSVVVQQGRDLYKGTINRVLDIGCGNFRNAIFFAQEGIEVDAVDIADMKQKREIIPDELRSHIHYYHKDLVDFDPQHTYQIMVGTRVIQFLHRAKLLQFIELAYNSLEIGGILCINFSRQGGVFERDEIAVPKHSYLLGEILFMFKEDKRKSIFQQKGSTSIKHMPHSEEVESYEVIFQKIA